jgi:hypothetical protein
VRTRCRVGARMAGVEGEYWKVSDFVWSCSIWEEVESLDTFQRYLVL